MNIYVGNLPFQTNENELQSFFEPFGKVDSVKVIKDKFTGKSRGFAFVEMTNDEEAKAAIAGTDGKMFAGRNLKVNEARPMDDRGGERSGGFGGGDRGPRPPRGGGQGGDRGGERRPRFGNRE